MVVVKREQTEQERNEARHNDHIPACNGCCFDGDKRWQLEGCGSRVGADRCGDGEVFELEEVE